MAEKKVVVITGSIDGFGAVLASQCEARGYAVVRSDLGKSKSASLQEKTSLFVQADVTKENDVKRLAQKTIKKYGHIDIWINNAGVWLPYAPVENVDVNKARKMFEVNFFGTVHGTRTALSCMRKQKFGTIVNIISVSALSGRPLSSMYCASKFAVNGFTKSVRVEIAKEPIRLLSVFPDRMKTHFFDAKKPKGYDDFLDPEFVAKKVIKNMLSSHPVKELVIQ